MGLFSFFKRNKQNKEKQEEENLEKERLAQEQKDQERLEKEKLEKERLDKERLEKERLELERIAAERLELEKQGQEKLVREKLEQEKQLQERLEKERLERDRLEQERRDNERLERGKLEQQRAEDERVAAENIKLEQEKHKQQEINDNEELGKGLKKTKEGVFSKLARAIAGKAKVDDDVLDRLEEALVTSDVGVDTTLQIIERIQNRVAKDKYLNTSELNKILREETAALLSENNNSEISAFDTPDNGDPYVIMVVGVNGVGKTTTIGKLANMFKEHGYSVVLGAADTFRAAAVDQLKIWAERAGVPIVAQAMGSDPASVAFDTVSSAKASHADVVIIDTAGRLHNKVNLMNELSKIKKVMQKVIPNAPQEVLLVIDASTGQNAIEQTKQFTEATDVNALAVTKLDGTAKGGVVLGISNVFQIPVKYIGVGEKIGDIQVFDKMKFVNTLFDF